MYASTNPATGEIVGRSPDANPAAVDHAVGAARAAFDTTSWRADPDRRVRTLRAFLAALEAERESLRDLLVREGGVPVRLTASVQLDGVFAELAWVIDAAQRFGWHEELAPVTFHGHHSRRWARHEPLGVAALLTPGNFPFALLAKRLFTALAAGNTVVVKPAPETPLVAAAVVRAADGVLPPGVLNLVTSAGVATVGERLCAHPGVDLVSVTGSTPTGQRVAELCAPHGKRVVSYLGGKSAHLVLSDAPFEEAVASGVRVCFHAGQACTLYTRLLVPRDRYDESLELLAEVFASVPVGDPADPDVAMGPLVSAALRDRFLAAIRAAEHAGGRIVIGGGVPADRPHGWFVEPTVLADLPPDAGLATTEVVGPALCVLPYDDDDHAVAIANQAPYALAAAVTSGSVERATAVADRLRAAAVAINDGLPHGPDAPYGGYLGGTGHNGGEAALRDYLAAKVLAAPV